MNDINTDQVTDLKTEEFGKDVLNGLSASPKRLSSKYFYDKQGDKLFQQIMKLEEYYLTRSEYEILDTYKDEILEILSNDQRFDLFELGAGDGYKTKLLLNHFIEQKANFTYYPIDISGNVLDELKGALSDEIPSLNVEPLEGDYFKMLRNNSIDNTRKKLILFLGSNIGNFSQKDALDFLTLLRQSLTSGDYFLLGVDLKKHPEVILNAYNDASGVTKDFNLNLLERINNTFGANFVKDQFLHAPSYDPATGECRSYLLSLENQTVELPELGHSIQFRKWEPIHMEISKKYDVKELEALASQSGFRVIKHFTDAKGYFVDSLWQAI